MLEIHFLKLENGWYFLILEISCYFLISKKLFCYVRNSLFNILHFVQNHFIILLLEIHFLKFELIF